MTRRRRHRGPRLPGLFTFNHGHITTEPDDVGDNPLTRACPHCSAGVGEPCTRRGRYGARQPIHGYHNSRKNPEDQ